MGRGIMTWDAMGWCGTGWNEMGCDGMGQMNDTTAGDTHPRGRVYNKKIQHSRKNSSTHLRTTGKQQYGSSTTVTCLFLC